MKLVGDVGGTKVLLALADDAGALVQKRRLASANFSDFEALLAAYLRDVTVAIDGGCLAVAGPVAEEGRSAKITNLPWHIDCAALEARFNLRGLTLANDFAAVAAGIAVLPDESRLLMQAGIPVAGGLKLVLGAGTGLGVAALAGDLILASEGGHVGFSPVNEIQQRIWQALQQEHGRVTAERVISGPGLMAIHRILNGEDVDPETIGTHALAGDATARRSVHQFFGCYGAFAGDMAMAFMAQGGVFLAGGVTQKLLPLLPGSPFLENFNAKAEHTELLVRMPVWAVRDAEIGLKGATMLAIRTLPD